MRTEWITNYLQVLEQLRNELHQYPDEDTLFSTLSGTTNSGGNLIMHLLGNILHFYGGVLLENGYVRDRDHEFNGQDSIEKMEENIARAKNTLIQYFDSTTESSFAEPFPMLFRDQTVTKGYMYIMLLHHFTYHLGQINYHRRGVMGEGER